MHTNPSQGAMGCVPQGGFRRWKTHDVYQQAFDQLLRALRAAERPPAGARPGGYHSGRYQILRYGAS